MWLYVPSAFAPVPVASTSLSASHWEDVSRSVIWRGTLRQPNFWRAACKTARFQQLQFGRTPQPSMERAWRDWLTPFLRDSHAPTIPSPVDVLASSASTAKSGATSRASLANLDPNGLVWRTSQASLLHTLSTDGDGIVRTADGRVTFSLPDSGLFLETWPRSGMTRNGSLYPLPRLALHTNANASSSWPTARVARGSYTRDHGQPGAERPSLQGMAESWPTPTSSETDRGSNRLYLKGDTKTGRMLSVEAERWPTPRAEDAESCGNHPNVTDSLTGATRNWATPKATDGGPNSKREERGAGGPDLQEQARLWQTPSTDSFRSRGGDRKNEQGLDQQARFWSTPMAQDCEQAGSSSYGRTLTKDSRIWATPQARDHRSGETSDATAEKNSRPLSEQACRYLPPGPAPSTNGEPSSPSTPTSRPPQLNPRFVCLLMGFLPGWTSRAPINSELWEMRSRQYLGHLLSGSSIGGR